MPAVSPSRPTLATLPSELRRLVVSNLVPDPDTFRAGWKEDLRHANLAHSCLHEWVPEYMFRDMTLKHVHLSAPPQLQRFTEDPKNAGLLNLVKHIQVQVPPAIHLGVYHPDTDEGIDILLTSTMMRLRGKFRVTTFNDMTDEQRQYCHDYHKAMVVPFLRNAFSTQLHAQAKMTWFQLFGHFQSLEEISVGCCERVDMPSPTVTNTFIQKHGSGVASEASPSYFEDWSTNVAWASCVIATKAPNSVRRLCLSIANADGPDYAPIDTLLEDSRVGLWGVHTRRDPSRLNSLSQMTLSVRGLAGVYSVYTSPNQTGFPGAMRQISWLLMDFEGLQRLELCNDLSIDTALRFSRGTKPYPKACLLYWFLIVLQRFKGLRTLCLRRFLFDKGKLQMLLPSLENLVLEDISFMQTGNLSDILSNEDEYQYAEGLAVYAAHLHGQAWQDFCYEMKQKSPSLRITLRRVASNFNNKTDHDLHPRRIEDLSKQPGVYIDNSEPYAAWFKPPQRYWTRDNLTYSDFL